MKGRRYRERSEAHAPCRSPIVPGTFGGRDSAGKHTLKKNCYHPTDDPPVPQTDTGSRVEYTKALRRLAVKELGKMTP